MIRLLPLFLNLFFIIIAFSIVEILTYKKELIKESKIEFENEIKKKQQKENKKIINQITQKQISKEDNLEKKKNIVNKEKILEEYEFFVQFGVYSKQNNLKKFKSDIENSLRNNFKNLKLKIFNVSNNVYKIVYIPKSIDDARKVCEYSKKLKIECYINKK
tara:strand:+ start:4581 stop:5063 length:483 start_codon:yes stop_codon:yes gene_type:complete